MPPAASSHSPESRPRLGRILVGADFTPPSRKALARALQLATEPGAEVVAVHVLKHRRLLTPQDEQLALAELAQFVGAFAPQQPPLRLRSKLIPTDGKVWETLRGEAAEEESQLVVLGRTGRHSIRGLVLGSTTERLARGDERSLLVVHPGDGDALPYRQPLVTVDFSGEADRAMELCFALAPEAKKVNVLHVYDRSYAMVLRASVAGLDRVKQQDAACRKDSLAQMEAFVARHQREGVSLIPLVVGGDARPDIRDQAGQLGADLLVVGRRGASGNSPIGSVAEALLRLAPVDLALTGRPTFRA